MTNNFCIVSHFFIFVSICYLLFYYLCTDENN